MYRNWIVMIMVVILVGAVFAQNARSERKQGTMQEAFAGLEAAAAGDQSNEAAAKKGLTAPAFKLSSLDNQPYQVGGKRDKPLLINFWASWCGPCKEEAPDLVKLYEKYKGQIDLYAVNITRGDSINDARSFAQKYGFTFPVLLDTNGEIADMYRIRVIPTSYLIDRNGNVQEVFNVLPPDELDSKIKAVIGN
jgi:thiol-disulfide isomerase/thioredoxin